MHNGTSHPKAEYDANGNIILRSDVPEPVANHAGRTSRTPHSQHDHVPAKTMASGAMKADQWTTVEEPSHAKTAHVRHSHTEAPKHSVHPVRSVSSETKSLLTNAMREGAAQYSDAAHKTRRHLGTTLRSLRSIPKHAKHSVRRFWSVADKPFSSLLPQRPVGKKRSKTTLFVIDIVRFGGTFALIFTVLFVGINYQSFWQVAKSALALNVDTQTEQALQQMVTNDSGEQNPVAVAAAADNRRKFEADSLLTYLPKVGPYENRLIIPKIGKNVPIVQPGMDALMKEDWKKFEEDVQASLHNGVVHYPGSAQPGNPGNFFITGHSSYYPWDDGKYKDVFARLHELDVGDMYSVYYGGDLHMYKVLEKKEVKPTDVSVLDQPTNERLATLMTCTPIGTTLRRLIVIAQEVDPATGLALQVGERGTDSNGNKAKPAVKMEALPI